MGQFQNYVMQFGEGVVGSVMPGLKAKGKEALWREGGVHNFSKMVLRNL